MANPFETLGLVPSFELDVSELEQRQRELNRAVHPDRHAGKPPAERREALSRAMDINQAFRALRDPAARADVLFELCGIHEVGERTLTDPALLSDMLEQRELLDEARRNKDRTRLLEMKQQMLERERQIVAALGTAFRPLVVYAASGDARAARGAEAETAQRLYAELKYVRRFAEEVAAIEDEI